MAVLLLVSAKVRKTFILILSIAIISLSILPRFLWLELIPNGLNWDEAAYGYNAFSLLKTGSDEWGARYPLFLRSFDEYKPALLSYLQIPFIALLGLNVLSVRLPVILLSIASLIAWFFILKQLGFGLKNASIGVLLMAISPWHFHYSRAAMDPMISFSFLLIGYALFLNQKHVWRWSGVMFLLLAAYTYSNARIFVIFLLLLHYIFIEMFPSISVFKERKTLPTRFKKILPTIICIISCFVLIVSSAFSNIGARAKQVLIFSQPEFQLAVNDSIYRSNVLDLPLLRLFSNKVITGTYTVIHNYLIHLDPTFLFFNRNPGARLGFSKHGHLLLAFSPFLIIGLTATKQDRKLALFFGGWLLLAPLPAAFSNDVPHSGRTLIMLPALIYFAALGIVVSYRYLNLYFSEKKFLAICFKSLIVLAISFNSLLYFVDLYRFYPEESYFSWQGDVRDALLTSDCELSALKKVQIHTIAQNTYIFDAFYHQISPSLVQKAHQEQGQEIMTLLNREYTEITKCELLNPQRLLIGENEIIMESMLISESDSGGLSTSKLYPYNRYYHNEPSYYLHLSDHLSDTQLESLQQECN